MNLRNRTNYAFEKILKPSTISDKIIYKMEPKNWETIVKKAEETLKYYSHDKATKPQTKRIQKRNGTYSVQRKKVIYNIPEVIMNSNNLIAYTEYLKQREEAIQLVANLKEKYLRNQLNKLTRKDKTKEQIIKHFRGQGIDIKSNL